MTFIFFVYSIMENQDPQEQVQPQEEQVQDQVQPQEEQVQSEQVQPEQVESEEVQKYNYTQYWFISSEIKRNISQYLDKTPEVVNSILDIGSFEGIGSAFFADNYLENEMSTLTCVDPFLTINTNDYSDFLQNGAELNFDFNISNCKNSNKITTHKITSDAFFENNTKQYNLIYIDGSRDIEIIKRDIEKSFAFLEKDGILWMNNYNYNKDIYDTINIFLESHLDQYDIIHNNYQIAIKKK